MAEFVTDFCAVYDCRQTVAISYHEVATPSADLPHGALKISHTGLQE